MSKDILEKAANYIQQKNYADAKILLKTLPQDATAQKWLQKIETIEAEEKSLDYAKALIQAKHYNEARKFLESLPHNSTARRWLNHLDKIALVEPNLIYESEKENKSGSAFYILLFILSIVVIGLFLYVSSINDSDSSDSSGDACGSCSEIQSCNKAYTCLRDGNSGLDRDGDGVPCENICPSN